MKKKIIFIIILFLIIGLLFLGFINYKNKKHTLSFNYLDNDIIINIYNTKNTKILEQIKEIYKEYDHLIDKENKYDRVNNLYYILYNDSKEESIKIDKKLYKMIESGIEWYQKSDGLIDISKGSVADIWKMYRDSTTGVPTTFELKRADINNINDIELLKNTKIKNNHVSMELLDIAKGFATYEVTKLLEKNNIDEYLISIGSSTIVGKHYNNKKYEIADKCIIATGGLSYKTTGSTGDGYKFAKKFGHTIIETHPSLVPFNITEGYCRELQGLALKNVKVSVYNNDKMYFSDQGEMLFTHFGVSGPLILSASCYIADKINPQNCEIVIDLKPALDNDTLDKRILKDFKENINRNLNNSLDKLLPKKLIPIIIDNANIDPYKKVHEITKEERERLVNAIKEMTLHVNGLRDYNEAIITKGGISVNEINPKTMESKKEPGIYFVGEVLDLDAMTGGYNLQIAWSTGYLAGNSICDW